jgi:hypothetical protein
MMMRREKNAYYIDEEETLIESRMNRITESISKVVAPDMRQSMAGTRPMRSSTYEKIKRFDVGYSNVIAEIKEEEEQKSKIDMIDFESMDNLKKYEKMMQGTTADAQKKFMTLIKSSFLPRAILSESKSSYISEDGEASQFEAIWIFEMVGRNFEQIKNPLEHGVLDTNKCFYIIFYRN